jgi:hypothetical protein
LGLPKLPGFQRWLAQRTVPVASQLRKICVGWPNSRRTRLEFRADYVQVWALSSSKRTGEMNKQVWTMATLAIAVSVMSCSSSKKSPSPDAGGQTDAGPIKKPDAGKPDAGKQDSGAMMTATAMPVPCGTNMCQPPPSLAALAGGAAPGGAAGGLGALGGLLPMVAACCLDTTMGSCGTMSAGGACMPPPKLDSRCPGVFGMMNGCCTASNQCGLDASMFAMGCVDLATVSAGPLGTILMPASPRACDAMSGGGEDGGAGTGTGNDGGN